jgi:hypothetical protein
LHGREENYCFALQLLPFLSLLLPRLAASLFFSPLTTHYIESDAFRVAMEYETAKGLHFPQSHFSPIRGTSTFTARSGSFEARNGEKSSKGG